MRQKKDDVQEPLPPLEVAQAYIKNLETELLHYKQDPFYSAYFAWARKVNETSDAINSFTLSLTGDDKSFERYVALLKVQPEQMAIIASLRNDYLKKDDAELEGIKQKQGIPLIEERVKTKAARQTAGRK